MEEHPIQGLMTTAMESLQSLVETNTIIGDPIETPDGTMIIPVSKVGFGFAAGGSEFSPQSSDSDATLPFGGGSGGGVSITPIAFLVINQEEVKMIPFEQHHNIYEKVLEMTPQVIDKVENILKEKGKKDQEHEKLKNNRRNNRRGRERDNEKEDKNNPLNFDI